jgi:hypothetical protein
MAMTIVMKGHVRDEDKKHTPWRNTVVFDMFL